MKKYLKKPYGLVVCLALLCFVLSFFGAMVNSSGFSVKIEMVTADMDAFYAEKYGDADAVPYRMTIGKNHDGMLNAKLTGYLYIPSGVSAENPAPCVILTNGYNDSKETQKAPAVEMARRGYVVFAFDQYDHGDSSWDSPQAFYFYVWSMYDAVEFMYSQPYVLKDAQGNGMISVSGHSMGGFSSEIAAAWDEMNVTIRRCQNYRMIAAVLSVGADFRYDDGYVTAYSGGFYPATYNTYGPRTCGTIAARYDEFFFDNTDEREVIEKNFVEDPVGYGMLGLTGPGVSGEFYAVDPMTNLAYGATGEESYENAVPGYGERVIYVVGGDHPYNTWSPECTQRMIEFYTHAFTYQFEAHGLGTLADHGIKDSSGQIWWLREVFLGLAMLCFIGTLISLAIYLSKLPFFKKVVTEEALVKAEAAEPPSKAKKIVSLLISGFSMLFICSLIVPLLERDAEDLARVTTLTSVVFLVLILLSVALGVVALAQSAKGKLEPGARKVYGRAAVGIGLIAALAVVIRYTTGTGVTAIAYGTNKWYATGIQGNVAYYAMNCGLIALLFTLITHFAINIDHTAKELGLKAKGSQVGTALLIGAIAVAAIYFFLQIIIWVFKVDLRIFMFNFNTPTWYQLRVALRYMPFFFIFYACMGIVIANATHGMTGWKADLMAVATVAIPNTLFLIYQYGVLETTGVAPFTEFGLFSIVCEAFECTLIALAIIQRRITAKTGNIWTGVFTNTFLFGVVAVASTCCYRFV